MSAEYREDRKKWGYRFVVRGKRFQRNTRAEAEKAERQAREAPMLHLAPRNGDSVLYVIQRGDDGPIKVGISCRLRERLKGLQNGNAEKLKVLRVYRMVDIEKAIHVELRKVAPLEGEWFPGELISLVDGFFKILPVVSWNRAKRIVKA